MIFFLQSKLERKNLSLEFCLGFVLICVIPILIPNLEVRKQYSTFNIRNLMIFNSIFKILYSFKSLELVNKCAGTSELNLQRKLYRNLFAGENVLFILSHLYYAMRKGNFSNAQIKENVIIFRSICNSNL